MKPEILEALRAVAVVWTPRVAISVAALCVLALTGSGIRCSAGNRCHGPKSSLTLWRPRSWLRRAVCGYELTGLIPMDQGYVRCPECGTLVRPGTRRWFRSAWRFEVIAPLCLLVALVCRNASYLHGGRWLARMPSPVLLTLEAVAPTGWSHSGRWALRDRLFAHELAPWESRWLRGIAVAQLGEDTIEGNADWAIRVLQDLGDDAIPPLEAALDSADWQRRQMAASLLRARCDPYRHNRSNSPQEPSYEPTARLFDVTVEGLRDDNLPHDWVRRRETFLSNGFDGLEFLARVGPRAAPACEHALGSDDPQQRLLAAAALGMMGSTASIERAAPILIAHLPDNHVPGDAHLAATAFIGFGPASLPYLRDCAGARDRQTQRVAASIIALLDDHNPSLACDGVLKSISGRCNHPYARTGNAEWNREAAKYWRRVTLEWPESSRVEP